ncbi:hypothetical protein ScPMuIL_016140 [Solemya velum]
MSANTVSPKLETERRALRYLDWLKKVESHPHVTSRNVVRRAIRRYEEQWLPLAAAHSKVSLIPPLDIAWVWHCHILAPKAYVKDCSELHGGIIPHTTLDNDSNYNFNNDYMKTKSIWENLYPSIPFEVDIDSDVEGGNSTYLSKLSYDLEKASSRQKRFYYQVSLPHYRSKVYLNNAFERYRKFLSLSIKHPDVFLVPCIDIELVWRTQLIFPVQYEKDSRKLFGSLFDHRDTTGERRPGTKLFTLQLKTAQLWKDTFKENYYFPGSMHRGNPDFSDHHRIDDKDLIKLCSRGLRVSLTHISIQGLVSSVQEVELTFSGNKSKSVFLTLDGLERAWDNIPSFVILKQDDKLLVSLTEQTPSSCCGGGSKAIGRKYLLTSSFSEKIPKLDGTVSLTENVQLGHGVRLRLEMELTLAVKDKVEFGFRAGNFKNTKPDMMQRMLDRIPNVAIGSDTACKTANSGESDKELFTCHMFRSINPSMSGLHLYYKNQLVVSGHQVSVNQLPFYKIGEEYVGGNDGCPHISYPHQKGILLKNRDGDVFVCLCYKSGKPGSSGLFWTNHYNLTGPTLRQTRQNTVFNLGQVDGATNVIGTDNSRRALIVSINEMSLAEQMAIELTDGALLHLLCEPEAGKLFSGKNKPTQKNKPGKTSNSNQKKQKAMKRNLKLAKAFAKEFRDELEDAENAGIEEGVDEADFEGVDENFAGDLGGYGDDMGALDNVASSGYCVDPSQVISETMFTTYGDSDNVGGGMGGNMDGGMGGFDGGMESFNTDIQCETNIDALDPSIGGGDFQFEGEY